MLMYVIIVAALGLAMLMAITDRRQDDALDPQKVVVSPMLTNALGGMFLFLFWFLTAFRGSTIGNDTATYLGYYQNIAITGVDPSRQIEGGYQYFCLFLSKISINPQFLLIFVATFCYGICATQIYRHSKNRLYSVMLLFCIVFSFFASGIRQAMAMCIVWVAYNRIQKGKFFGAAALIVLASCLHLSALVGLVWFFHKVIPKNPVLVLVTAMGVAAFSASGLLNTVLTALLREYASYFESENAGTGWLGISYYVLRATVFFLIVYYAYRKNKSEGSLPLANTVFLLLTVCLGFSVNLFERASLYFLLPTVVDLTKAFSTGEFKNRKMLMTVLGTVMLAFFIVTRILRPEWNNLYPYVFFWN